MAYASQSQGKLDDPNMIELTGKILVVAVIVLFLVVMFVFFLHLYSKWFWNQRPQGDNNPNTTTRQRRRRRRRFDFSPGHEEINVTSALNRGLDPFLLKTIPVVLFSPKEFKDGLECAVCLCDVCEGEMARLLPKCNHGFHVDCIDMWFQSHSTCPICRNPVMSQESSTVETILRTPVEEEDLASIEVPNFPTNVLFWGNETQVSTLGPSNLEGPNSSESPCPPSPPPASSSSSSLASTSDRPCVSLVIDIPRQINEVEEEDKSPMPTRLRSLKRLLSRDRRANPSSPRIVDVEQGGR